MLYVFLSICCSIIVSVLLKLAKRYHIDVFQAIAWNYSIAIVLTWIFFKPRINVSDVMHLPALNYLALGILFPVLFVVLAASTRLAGIVRTDVAQRLSLFIPVVAAFLLFHETAGTARIIGIILAFVAIVCSIPWQQNQSRKVNKGSWLYLLAVFAGFGVIDVLLKQLTGKSAVPFTTAMFIIFMLAYLLCMIALVYRVSTRKTKFSWPHILIGWILGTANFGNILFYLKAHQAMAGSPSIVFSAMNIGVIVVGALVGVMIFKERLSMLNKIGIGIAVLAIVVMYFPGILWFLN